MKFAFGVCSLGIGHATRSAPIIRKLLSEGHDIVIISHGRALSLLRREFPELRFYDLEDYPIKYTEKAHQFFPYFLMNSHKILKNMIKMHSKFLRIDSQENFDAIISDSRYDVFNRFKPSYIIIHQLRIMLKSSFLRGGTMLYNGYMSKFFTKILVPDFAENGLSGKLSHKVRFLDEGKIEYVGVLSPFRHLSMERDVDILISISGPEPQRTLFEKKIREDISQITGKIVVTLGRPEGEEREFGGAEVHSYLPFDERERMMNRAKVVISRSGYSTIMDLYVTGGKAGFVPTPGQPEQRYLARHMESMGISPYMDQESLDLPTLIDEAKKYSGFKGNYDVSRTVERIMEVIL